MHGSGRYRQDIDGLRAIAVLLVTFFHINEALIPGGFVGVDVFFVISGYLITNIIVRERREGTFTYAEFYRRRVRRILPAMFAVTFVTLAMGLLLFLPEDVERLAWSALATSASAANIFFTYFLDTSYFAADSATVPLLHMWSLGVEEQFYLIWPALLLVLLKWPRQVLPALTALIVLSVAIGEWQLRSNHQEWAYYMLPSRAFQLLIGGALVFVSSAGQRASAILAPAGLFLILASAFMLEGSSKFPGINAVPVTIGTAAILAAGGNAGVVSTALSLAPLRAVGLISYSLYLWHWPVLAFQRYFYGDLDPMQQVTSFIAMSGLATASYFLVELPFRHSSLSFRQSILRLAAVPSLLLLVCVSGLIASGGYGPLRLTNYPAQLASVPAAAAPHTLDYVCQRPLLRRDDLISSRCVLGNGVPRILLYGDSNAAHYVGVVGELAKSAGVTFRNYAHSACPPIGADPTPFVSDRYLRTCVASHAVVAEDLRNYDVVFLGGAWVNYASNGVRHEADLASSLQAFVRELSANGASVVLLDTIPLQPRIDARCGRKMLKLAARDCGAEGSVDVTPTFTAQLNEIAQRTPGVQVMSVRSRSC